MLQSTFKMAAFNDGENSQCHSVCFLFVKGIPVDLCSYYKHYGNMWPSLVEIW